MTCHTFLVWSRNRETIFEVVLCTGSPSCQRSGMCTELLWVFQLPETPLRLMTDQHRRMSRFPGILYPGIGWVGLLDRVTQVFCSGED